MVVACASQPSGNVNESAETATRVQIAATNLEDTVVVDCQLPGKLQRLGGTRTYLTPGVLVRTTTLECRTRGGEYTLGDLSSGTLSLKRWLPLAEKGDTEAQYYVARIYANGMSGVPVDYAQAAHWYRQAADKGYAAAEQELGYMYEKGLGVAPDAQTALNLQRKAFGLGEELDYAWKIGAAKESAAREIESLESRLEAANNELQATRSQLFEKQEALARSRAEFKRSADAVIDLRARLEAARTSGAGADAARVKELESKLASDEKALRTDQDRIEQLAAELNSRQSELNATLQRSESASVALTEVMAQSRQAQASSQAQTQSLRAQLAQTEQRLIRSQQELTEARTRYQRDVQTLVEQRDDLTRARAQSGDEAAALLAARQRELERQQLRIQAMEAELAAAKRDSSTGGSRLAAADARNEQLARDLASERARFADAGKQLADLRQQLATLQSRSKAERDTLVAQLKAQMSEQVNARESRLANGQRHLETLEYETSQLRAELKSLQAQRAQEGQQHASEERVLREQLSTMRAEAAARQEELDKARTESAREQSELVRVQTQMELQSGRDAQMMARLNAELKQHQASIQARDDYIQTLKQQLQQTLSRPVLTAQNIPTRAPAGAPATETAASPLPAPPVMSSADTQYLDIARRLDGQHPGQRFALLVGNSRYQHMAPLQTPGNDVQTLAQLLQERYDFKVNTLEDATEDQLMLELDKYARTLGENDSLLIYFAGHGDHDLGPPERAYWLGVDADPVRRHGYVEVENIQQKIKQMRARHILLVADSCFSGAIAHGSSVTIGRGVNEARLRIEMSHRARMVLTSGGDTPVVDSGGEENHSLFATYLIQALRQNTTAISGEMLAHQLYERMKPRTDKLHIAQAPTYAHLSDANQDCGDFYFLPRPVQMAALDPN